MIAYRFRVRHLISKNKFTYQELSEKPEVYGGRIDVLIPCLDPYTDMNLKMLEDRHLLTKQIKQLQKAGTRISINQLSEIYPFEYNFYPTQTVMTKLIKLMISTDDNLWEGFTLKNDKYYAQ